jgi:hypothetical protein
MRRAIFPILIVLAAACSTAPQRLSGRYGLLFEPSLTRSAPGGSFSEQITLALRDRLGSVDVVDSTAAAGYDALIVIRPAGQTVAPAGHPATRGPIVYDREGRPVSPSAPVPHVRLIEFDVVKNGRNVTSGVARLQDEQVLDSIDRSGRADIQPVQRPNGYEQSREVAQAVVSALEGNAN